MAKRLGCWPCDEVALGSNPITCYSLVSFFCLKFKYLAVPCIWSTGCLLPVSNLFKFPFKKLHWGSSQLRVHTYRTRTAASPFQLINFQLVPFS